MPQPVRSRVKACERCQLSSNTLYRVASNASGTWRLVCPACQASAKTQAGYRYGGTWKADKRH